MSEVELNVKLSELRILRLISYKVAKKTSIAFRNDWFQFLC